MPQLRVATNDDALTIARIHIEARRDAMPYLPDLHSGEETEAWIRDIVLPAQAVWVAVVNDVVVGYIAVEGGTVESLYILPGYQGRGIGSALLNLVMERSGGTLDLWTFQRNAHARSFYEARGFRSIELTDGANNEEREPDVRYQWRRDAHVDPT